MINENLKRMARKRKIGLWVVILGLMYGGILVLLGLGMLMGNTFLLDEKHISNPDLPVKDIQNATYEFTIDELIGHDNESWWWMIGGGVLLAAGLGAALTMITKKDIHREHCKGTGEARYCSECGLKLSDLKEEDHTFD